MSSNKSDRGIEKIGEAAKDLASYYIDGSKAVVSLISLKPGETVKHTATAVTKLIRGSWRLGQGLADMFESNDDSK